MASTSKSESSAIGGIYAKFVKEIEQDVDQRVSFVIDSKVAEWDLERAKMRAQIETSTAHLGVEVNDQVHTITGLRHKQLPMLIKLAAQRMPIFIVGPAGSAKTTSCEQVADGLGLSFHSISVGAQTSKTDLMGFIDAGGTYRPSEFRKAFENGGVFCLDEADAGNANVLVQLNAALSNHYCAFPDGMIKRNPDFVLIACGNTYGNGANRQYVGRTQLDAATLDRFVMMDWQIDEALEAALAGEAHESVRWHNAIVALRQKVADEGMRVLVTPRATLRGSVMLSLGLSLEEVCNHSVLGLFPADKSDWAFKILKKEYNKSQQEKKAA